MNPLESFSVDTNGNVVGWICKEWLIVCFSEDTDGTSQFACRKVGIPMIEDYFA